MKPELLAPAGDLEKVKIALLYGADAVYIGGKEFSLRARASKFSLEDMQSAVQFAHERNKKIYVTMNIVPHDEDMPKLDEYLKQMESIGVDAIICSSPAIIYRAKATTNLEIHLSTQFSVSNSLMANFWKSEGISRVVLSRECSVSEMKAIKSSAEVELEVFIHGGMCVSYSGRCTLSNYMSDRDANRGGCAHSCRWRYSLIHQSQIVGEPLDFQMSSKDLESLHYIRDLMELGVDSLKIEGRMKSIHYIATIVHTYRLLIDDIENNREKPMEFYEKEIQKAENRLTSHGFMEGITQVSEQLYDTRSEIPTKEFVGIVLEYHDQKKEAVIEQRNYFQPGDLLERFSPNEDSQYFTVLSIHDSMGNALDAARHPLQILVLKTDIVLQPYDLLRKVL